MAAISLDDAAWASPWRRRRVSEKVALSLGLVLTALLAPVWPGTLLVALASLALMIGWARIRPTLVAGAMVAPATFIIIGALSVAIAIGTPTGDIWWRWGPLSINADSARRSLGLFGHGIAGTLAVLVLATTTPMVDLLAWMRRLRMPDPLLEIASLMYRMLFLLLDATQSIRAAQVARCSDAAPLRRRFGHAAQLTGAVFLRAWRQSVRLEDGLRGRGFESALLTLAPRRERSAALVVVGAATLAAIWAISWQVAR